MLAVTAMLSRQRAVAERPGVRDHSDAKRIEEVHDELLMSDEQAGRFVARVGHQGAGVKQERAPFV